MSELILSHKQLFSHLFFEQLVAKRQLTNFLILADKLLGDVESDLINTQTLMIFAEGLSLAKVLDVQERCATWLKVAHLNIVQVAGVSGFAVAAKVSILHSDGLHNMLLQIADQLSVELCLLDKTPSLSKPGLLMMDMDSTVIAVECIDEIATLAGVGEQVAQVTAQAMQGKLDFAQSLDTRVACLSGASEQILQQVRDALPLMPGIGNLLSILKQHNWKLAIASGGFTYFADYLALRLELDAAVANHLEIKNGLLTGQVSGEIIDGQVKARTLEQLSRQWSIDNAQTVAIGDGANDLKMMAVAALGVAFHAKPLVSSQAQIAISRSSMDSLLWVLAAD